MFHKVQKIENGKSGGLRRGAGVQVASNKSFFKRADGPHLPPQTVNPLEETVERKGGGS